MRREWWHYAIVAVLLLLALRITAGILSSRPLDAELARTVREALRMTRQAHQDADAAARRGSAFRLIAMAVGTAVPLVIVYLIYKLHLGSEPQAPEMLGPVERERLEARDSKRAELPSPALRLPECTSEPEEVDKN